VVERSAAMDWYRGPTLLEFLESAPAADGMADAPLRLPVQCVIRAGEQRGYAGQLAGGTVGVGDEVVVLPSGLSSRVSAVEGPGGPVESASAPLSVAVSLEDELDVGRGALICPPGERPVVARELEATVCWLGESPGRVGGRYLIKHTTRCERVRLEAVREMLDVTTLDGRPGGDSLGLNDIARVVLRSASELAFDPYRSNRWTGAFILIDEATNDTVGAGMISG
jgi:bifunctional enzyme CysN/CysC